MTQKVIHIIDSDFHASLSEFPSRHRFISFLLSIFHSILRLFFRQDVSIIQWLRDNKYEIWVSRDSDYRKNQHLYINIFTGEQQDFPFRVAKLSLGEPETYYCELVKLLEEICIYSGTNLRQTLFHLLLHISTFRSIYFIRYFIDEDELDSIVHRVNESFLYQDVMDQ